MKDKDFKHLRVVGDGTVDGTEVYAGDTLIGGITELKYELDPEREGFVVLDLKVLMVEPKDIDPRIRAKGSPLIISVDKEIYVAKALQEKLMSKVKKVYSNSPFPCFKVDFTKTKPVFISHSMGGYAKMWEGDSLIVLVEVNYQRRLKNFKRTIEKYGYKDKIIFAVEIPDGRGAFVCGVDELIEIIDDETKKDVKADKK